MSEYIIIVDSACDLGPERIEQYGVKTVNLSLTLNDKEYDTVPCPELSWDQFFNNLREGNIPKTSAATVSLWRDAAEAGLKEGKDVLMLAFSSALSSTSDAAHIAMTDLQEEYPDRKVYAIDSLCASLGFGLFVHYAVKAKNEGMGITEAYQYLLDLRLKICHWFTVDDLMYLKKGGRVSAGTALVGTLIGIKPVMHVDNEGRLINVAKARGRQASLTALVDRMAQTVTDPENQTVFICQGDCYEDAKFVANLVTERFGITDIYIDYTGAVISSHTGPGVLALFFVGKSRI